MLDFVFQFITKANLDTELSPLLCGYFTKLMLSLLAFNKVKLHEYIF